MKEQSLRSVTEEQRRDGQKDQDLVNKILVVRALKIFVQIKTGRRKILVETRQVLMAPWRHLVSTTEEQRNLRAYFTS